jgi:hypothetical protein
MQFFGFASHWAFVKTLQDLKICDVHQGFCVSKCFSGTMVRDSMRLCSQLRKR